MTKDHDEPARRFHTTRIAYVFTACADREARVAVTGLLHAQRVEWSLQPLRCRDVPVGKMPGKVDGVVGRECELGPFRELHRATRLLTTTEPGGVGERRPALRLRAELSAAFPNGSRLADVRPVANLSWWPSNLATCK